MAQGADPDPASTATMEQAAAALRAQSAGNGHLIDLLAPAPR